MQDLVSNLVAKLGVSEPQASGGAALLLKAARDKLGAAEFDQSIGTLPGMPALLDAAPRAGGVGKLFGRFAAAVGGNRATMIATIVGGFNTLGMTPKHAEAFAPVLIEYLRDKLDAPTAQRIEQLLRA